MKTRFHQEITAAALAAHFSPAALKVVIAANIGQDALPYQLGHDHFHYDCSAFANGDAYVDSQRDQTRNALAAGQPLLARRSFGRLTHTVQDFYAHSNYVELWQAAHGPADPRRVDPLDAAVRLHPNLHSGRLYYPLEILSFIPALAPLVLPHLPHDSHTHMNKDDPSRPHFELAYHAAIRRTWLEFERLAALLPPGQVTLLTGCNTPISASP